jgi:ribosomal protein S18 acetylase RimI-like enzyme
MTILQPANHFSLEELTEAYNQTRIDYIIPMPMNPSRLQEYITLYDIDLPLSRVALVDHRKVGLVMLGARGDQCWITRLGVLPEGRRRGIGEALMQEMIAEATQIGFKSIWLEVISGNLPAYNLFVKCQFGQTRELIVARRAPKIIHRVKAVLNARVVHYLQHDEVIELHCRRKNRLNWLNALETMHNVRKLSLTAFASDLEHATAYVAPHLSGMLIEFQDGSQGWISYQASNLQLKQIATEVIQGDPTRVTADLLAAMHHLHAAQDAVIENIADDEQWKGYQQAGYFEVFRRLEFVRHL